MELNSSKSFKSFIAAALAAVLAVPATSRADIVLANNADVAGLGVVTNAMGSSSFFPDACTNFTMEAWIKPSAYQSNADVFSPIFSVTTSNKSGYSRYIFGLRQSKLSLFQATVTSGDRFPVSSADVTLNTWTHVAVTHTATEVKFYINGSLDATLTGSFLPPVGEYNNSHLTIGGYHSVVSLNTSSYTTARVFQGSLADVRVWTKARTLEEIASDYQSRLRGDEDGLLLYAPFDDAAGGVARDMASGQRLIAPDTMRFVEDATLPTLSPASPRLVGEGYLASTRTGGNQGASAIVTDVDFANNANGTGPDFTFETWVRPDAYPYRESFLFAQWKEGESNPNRFLMGFRNTGRFGFFIGGTWKETDNPIPLGRWTHLAATRSGSTLKLYVDGALAKTFENYTTLSPWSSDYPHDLTLGGVDGAYCYTSGAYARINNSRSFAGAMREARVWTVARTADEIAESYKRKVHLSDNGLVGYWPLDGVDEGGATRLVNLKGGAVGTIVAGWEDVEPLNLRDAPAAFTIIFR